MSLHVHPIFLPANEPHKKDLMEPRGRKFSFPLQTIVSGREAKIYNKFDWLKCITAFHSGFQMFGILFNKWWTTFIWSNEWYLVFTMRHLNVSIWTSFSIYMKIIANFLLIMYWVTYNHCSSVLSPELNWTVCDDKNCQHVSYLYFLQSSLRLKLKNKYVKTLF